MYILVLIVSTLIVLLIPSGTFVNMANSDTASTHRAWVLDTYGQIKDLKLKSIPIPVIKDGNEILIKVSAASVNPIDNAMINGYGRTLLRILRVFKSEFPLIVGRDFSGIVTDKGHKIGDEFNIGDRVYGLIPLQKQGCFAEYVIADKSHVLKIPDNLTFTEAASILYTAMTAWSALYPSGKFRNLRYPDTKVLILGASGGVGTQAVQIVKAEGATVVGTCSADAVQLVRSLGADYVFDYRNQNYARDVADVGKYDIILDCANYGLDKIPDSWKYAVYIGLDPPVANYTDWYGTIPGLILSLGSYARTNLASWMKGHSVQWGFFSPNPQGLTYINKLVEQRKIKPIVQKTFEFIDLPKAMETLAGGHLRGKIVVEYP